jgi:beta-lactamase class D
LRPDGTKKWAARIGAQSKRINPLTGCYHVCGRTVLFAAAGGWWVGYVVPPGDVFFD